MNLTHRQARKRIEAALDAALTTGREPELDEALAAHLAACAECRAYAEQAASLDAQLTRHLPQAWPVPPTSAQSVEQAIQQVRQKTRRKNTMNLRNFLNSLRRLGGWGLGAVGIATLVGIVIFSVNLLPRSLGTPEPAALTGVAPSITPLLPTASPEIQGIAPGDWVATTDFGTLVLTVDEAGTKIMRVTFQFSEWNCGGVTHSAEIVDASRWLITDQAFTVYSTFDQAMQDTMEINGTYNPASQKFYGTWDQAVHGTLCSGAWEASRLDAQGATISPTRTPLLPTASPEIQGIAPGDWAAATDFGTLVLTVDDTGTKIKRVTFQFSEWNCGGVTHSAEIVDASRWLITDQAFTIYSTFDQAMQDTMEINGTYDHACQKFYGTWDQAVHGTLCSGVWEASRLDAQGATISPTRNPLPETYTVQKGDTWISIASTFNRSVQYLQTMNGTELFVGQVLRISPVAYPPATPDVEIPEGAVVIDYFAWDADSDTVKAIADEFNRSQSVYFVRVTEEDAAFGPEGFTPEDILANNDCFSDRLAQEQLSSAYSLSALLDTDPDGAALLEDIPVALWAAVRWDGPTYGLPLASQPLVIYYNQSHFETLGLDLLALGWAVDDFWSMASAASTNSVYGFVPIGDYSFLFAEQGITLIDIFCDPPQVNFNTPETARVGPYHGRTFSKRDVPETGRELSVCAG